MASLLTHFRPSWHGARIKPLRLLGGLCSSTAALPEIHFTSPVTSGIFPRAQSTTTRPVTMGAATTNQKANVLLIGSGGVGTMGAYALEKGGKASVTAVLRSNYSVVKEQGFTIDSLEHGKVQEWRPTTSELGSSSSGRPNALAHTAKTDRPSFFLSSQQHTQRRGGGSAPV